MQALSFYGLKLKTIIIKMPQLESLGKDYKKEMCSFWIQKMPNSYRESCAWLQSDKIRNLFCLCYNFSKSLLLFLLKEQSKTVGKHSLRESYSCYPSCPSATGNASHFQHWWVCWVPQRSPSTFHFPVERATDSSPSSQRQNNYFLYSTPNPWNFLNHHPG